MKENIIIGVTTAALIVFVYLVAYGFMENLAEYVYARPENFLSVSLLVVAAISSFFHRGDDNK